MVAASIAKQNQLVIMEKETCFLFPVLHVLFCLLSADALIHLKA